MSRESATTVFARPADLNRGAAHGHAVRLQRDHRAAELQLAARLIQADIQYRWLDGVPFTPPFPKLHHRNETLFGLLAPWLSVTARVASGRYEVAFRLGITLPLGKTEENPFTRGELGLPYQHLQFGTGTVNPVLGVSWTVSVM